MVSHHAELPWTPSLPIRTPQWARQPHPWEQPNPQVEPGPHFERRELGGDGQPSDFCTLSYL
jgi:hypothetical protein